MKPTKGAQSALSKTQKELYDAMKSGTEVAFMPYMGRFRPNPYYFRYDNHKRCTAAALALIEKGIVEIYDKDFRGHMIRLKEATS